MAAGCLEGLAAAQALKKRSPMQMNEKLQWNLARGARILPIQPGRRIPSPLEPVRKIGIMTGLYSRSANYRALTLFLLFAKSP